jgi:hypothetical protein
MTQLQNNINKWFSKNFKRLQNQVSNNIATEGMNVYSDELLSVCLESFLTRTPEQQLQMLEDGKIENYVLKCCSFQIKSSTSPFYRESRRFKMSAREDKELPILFADDNQPLESREDYQCMMDAIEELHWYHRTLIQEKWFNKMSFQDMRKKYGITLSSLQNDMKQIYHIIRSKCQC